GHAALHERDEEASSRERERRQHTSPQPRTDAYRPGRQRSEIVQVRSDRTRPQPPAGEAVPGNDTPRLPRSVDDTPDDNRRSLEVVVANVVLRYLVEPEQ